MGRFIFNIMDIMLEYLIKWNFKEGKNKCIFDIFRGKEFELEKRG